VDAQYLLSLLVLLIATAVGLYAYLVTKRMKLFEKRIALLEGVVERLVKHDKVVARAALHALRSIRAEDFLSKLRAKRRRRYIAFYIVYEGNEPPSPQEVEKAIIRAIERLGGQLSVALGGVQLVYYDPERAAGVIRCTHDTKYVVLAAMGIIRKVGGKRAIIIPVRTSGTIKRAKKALPS